MKKTLLGQLITPALLLLATVTAHAQGQPYHWQAHRSLTSLNDEEKQYDLYYPQIKVIYDLRYEGDNLVCYVTDHDIIRVNTDQALNSSNQIYIAMDGVDSLVTVHARTLTPKGKEIDFDKSNMKEITDKDGSRYNILAVEGAEVGGEIEYYYTRKIDALNFVSNVFQYGFPVKTYSFILRCPENLEYDFKVYNSPEQVAKTDTTKTYNQYELTVHDIPGLPEEEFAAYQNTKKRLEFKLAYNSKAGNGRLFTWEDAGKRIYDRIYDFDSDEEASLKKFIKSLKLSGNAMDDLAKAEAAIKTTCSYQETVGDGEERLDAILKNKYTDSRGFTRLYAALLSQLKIPHEIVLASDRFKKRFDPSFDTWNFLEEYLIYIDQTKQFLSPKDMAFRLGTIPENYIGTWALFVRPEQVQDYTYPVAHIKRIPEPPWTENMDNIDMTVTFSPQLTSNTVNVQRTFTGYQAEFYKTGCLRLEKERKEDMLNGIVKYLAQDAAITSLDISSANTDYSSWHKPFAITSTFTTSSYIESAGNAVLFKVGDLIGPQAELYQDKGRVSEVVNDFNRGYLRKITVKIPAGYAIKNAGDLVIDKQAFDKDKLVYSFVSKYAISGQDLDIQIDEFYDRLDYPVGKFEDFRKVVNASADWNKVVLVMVPKGQ